jgi:hypothetical protein
MSQGLREFEAALNRAPILVTAERVYPPTALMVATQPIVLVHQRSSIMLNRSMTTPSQSKRFA